MSDMEAETEGLPATQLREYYDALHGLKEQEQTALAELHADDPARLIARFDHSVKTVAAYPEITEAFHDKRSEGWTAAAGDQVTSTTTFVANLAVAARHEVTGSPELDFDFVDREIFPLRSTTIPVDGRGAQRRIDLLLRDCHGLPIVGELKVAGDSPTYYALVQALMYAAELSSESQLRRLAEHYDFLVPTGQPAISIYLIAYAAPERGAYRARSFEASKIIAQKLIADRRVAAVVRHIVYLESSSVDGQLVFKHLF
jgi:hypothetical protein